MQTITVLPIVRGSLKGMLTYFAKESISVGSVIMVPIRNRDVPALVIEVKEVADMKTALKSSDFPIRKITRMRPKRLWTPQFIHAAEKTAYHFAHGFGETLLSLTPKTILDAEIDGALKNTEGSITSSISSAKPTVSAIQENAEHRMESYQRHIRESFVRGESIFICLPSSEDVLRVAETLRHGIEDYVFAIHNNATRKSVIELWGKICNEAHAVVVVGTPQYLTLPRFFKTIIVDEEQARSWCTVARPHIDLRIFIEHYARETGSHLIFGAPILRPEIHVRLSDGSISEWGRVALHARLPSRSEQPLITSIIDPRLEEKETRERTGKRVFKMISEHTQTNIAEAIRLNESVVLITARKGLAPITVCSDCGTVIRCPECDTPLVIHKRENNLRVFTCHSCGFMRAPEENDHEICPSCKGWRLEGLGVGTEQIEEAIKKAFPETPCFVFDGDRIKTPAQARKLFAQFKNNKKDQKGAILIATPMVVPYLKEVDHTVVISIDSLFAIPDFRMHERIFALILALRERTAKTLIIQTRTDDTTLFVQAIEGNLVDFMESELALRKAFSYPPFGTIIKITIRGKRDAIAFEIENLKTYLSEYAPLAPNTVAREPRGVFRMHLILKLAHDAYPDDTLIGKLRALPTQFTVEVNPDHLL